MKGGAPSRPMVRVFVSYAHEDAYWMQRLRSVIRFPGVQLDVWSDQNIPPGMPWDSQIKHELDVMHVFVALISVHFASSDYIQRVECPVARERHKSGEIEIVPVYVAPPGGDECAWLMKLQRVPGERSWMELLKEFPQYDLTLPQIRTAIKDAIERVKKNIGK